MKYFAIFSVLVIALALWLARGLLATPEAPNAAENETPALLDLLFTLNEANREKLVSGEYRFTEVIGDELAALERRQDQRSGKVIFRDDLRHTVRHEIASVHHELNGPITHHKAIEVRAVVGPRYAGVWQTDDPVGYQYDHPTIEDMQPEVKDRLVSSSGQDFLDYGYGIGSQSLREIYESNLRREMWAHDWTVEQEAGEDGSKLYSIKGFSQEKDGPVGLRQEYVLNADRGFLLVDAFFYGFEGEVRRHQEVVAAESAIDGVWVPAIVRDTGGEDLTAKPEEVTLVRRIEMEFDRVNQPVNPELFTIAALGMPDGLLVARQDPQGVVTTNQVLGGVPKQGNMPIHIPEEAEHLHLAEGR